MLAQNDRLHAARIINRAGQNEIVARSAQKRVQNIARRTGSELPKDALRIGLIAFEVSACGSFDSGNYLGERRIVGHYREFAAYKADSWRVWWLQRESIGCLRLLLRGQSLLARLHLRTWSRSAVIRAICRWLLRLLLRRKLLRRAGELLRLSRLLLPLWHCLRGWKSAHPAVDGGCWLGRRSGFLAA